MYIFRFVSFIVVFLAFNSTIAFAQTAQDINNANQQSNEFIQNEQQRQFDELQKQRLLPDTQLDIGAELSTKNPAEAVKCFVINEITLEGVTVLSSKEQDSLTSSYLGNCVGLAEINELIRSITNFYVEKGYVTTRAYIPQQDLSDGSLNILIVEGTTKLLIPINRGNDIRVKTAFPPMIGEVLNLNDIEQGVAQLNRLSSNDVKIDLKPGAIPGETLIFVTNRPKRRVNGTFSIDNSGSETTGDWQGGGTFNFDNFLGLNERIYAGYRQNTESSSVPKESSTISGGFFVPYGYFTLSGNLSYYDYASRINGQVQDFDTKGTSNSANIALDWLFYRKRGTTWSLNGGYTYKDTKNLLEDVVLTSSSKALSIFDMNINHSTSFLGGSFNTSLGVALGVEDFLGSDSDAAGLADTAPTNSFKKLKANASYFKPFQLAKQQFSFSSSMQGQFANDFLPGTEQFSTGGRYTVRGFDDTLITGDRGIFIRNDLSMNLPQTSLASLDKVLGTVSPYVGYDAGHIFRRNGQIGGSMAGAAIGLRNYGGAINFDITAATPLGGREDLTKDKFVYYAQLGVSF